MTVCARVRVKTRMYMHTYVCVCVLVFVCLCVCVCVCVCVYDQSFKKQLKKTYLITRSRWKKKLKKNILGHIGDTFDLSLTKHLGTCAVGRCQQQR